MDKSSLEVEYLISLVNSLSQQKSKDRQKYYDIGKVLEKYKESNAKDFVQVIKIIIEGNVIFAE